MPPDPPSKCVLRTHIICNPSISICRYWPLHFLFASYGPETDPVHCIGGGTEGHPHNFYACSVPWSEEIVKHAYIFVSLLTPTSCRSATRNVCTITSNVASQAISLDSSALRTHYSQWRV